MTELLRLQDETKKMLRSVLLPNKEGLLLSGESQAGFELIYIFIRS